METVMREDGALRSVLAATGLSLGGIVLAELLTIPALFMDPTIATDPGAAARPAVLAFFVLNFAGFFVAGALYLAATRRGWSYVDLTIPSLRGWGYVVAGVVASIAFVIAVNIVATVLQLPSTENQVIQFIGGDPNMVLLLIVIVFFLNAPAEEFLFRNVIQKRLYAAFSRMQAVLVTSVIFALIHIPAYSLAADGAVAEPAAIAVPLVVVAGGSIIFGTLYAKTDNLVVPIAAHASFNAFQFAILYLVLRFAPEELEGAMAIAPF